MNIIVICLTCVVFIGTTSALLAGPTEHHSSSSQSVLDSIATPAQLLQPGAIGKDHIRVAVVNTYGWCVEVEAAVLYSFTSLPQVQVHSFNDYQEPGTMRFLAKVNPTASYQVWEDFISNPLIFDLVVVVDWFPPGHMMANEKGNLLMRTLLRPEYRGKIVITLHEPRTLPWSPDDALYRNFSDIIKDDRVHIFTISPYIAAVTEGFAVAGVHKPVQWYAPVFPWRQIACRLGTAGCTTGTRRGLIVQGNIDPNKRKYASLFEGLLKKPHLIASGNLEVHLVGRGGIHIPEQLEASVKVVSGFGQEVSPLTSLLMGMHSAPAPAACLTCAASAMCTPSWFLHRFAFLGCWTCLLHDTCTVWLLPAGIL
jgi:hypothetical protein